MDLHSRVFLLLQGLCGFRDAVKSFQFCHSELNGLCTMVLLFIYG